MDKELELFQLIEQGKISAEGAAVFSKIVNSAVKEAINECQPCPIPADAFKEVGHLTGMIKDLGKGDIGRGVETLRENHRFIKRWNKMEEQAGKIVVKLLVGFVFMGILAATMFGLFGKKIPFKV